MILPSNSSMKVFGDNTTTCFTTLLPQEINLKGNWEVGLSEILFPRTFLHVTKEDKTIAVEDILNGSEPSELIVDMPFGLYQDIPEFLRHLNKAIINSHVEFKLSAEDNGTYVQAVRKCTRAKCRYDHKIVMSRKMFDILGYVDIEHHFFLDYEPKVAIYPASVVNSLPKQLYVYTDICEPCVVGDVQASLLRIVPVNSKDYSFGTTQYQTFAPINYIPLLKHNFRTIVIDIRDHLGSRCPFQYGHSTVTLHFRRVEE